MAEGKTIRTRRKDPETESIRLVINGQTYDLNIGSRVGEVEPFHTLSQTLRDTLGLTGTKLSCDQGACGACTVIMDGQGCAIVQAFDRGMRRQNDHHDRRLERPGYG